MSVTIRGEALLELARDLDLHIVRDPSDLEGYPENDGRQIWQITLQGEVDYPARAWIDLYVYPDGRPGRAWITGVFEAGTREASSQRQVRAWLKRYGEPLHEAT